jgi:hypothetical protein
MKDELDFNVLKKMSLCFVVVLNLLRKRNEVKEIRVREEKNKRG